VPQNRDLQIIFTGRKEFLGVKLHKVEFTKHMNEFVSDGWELVTTFETNKPNGETRDVVAIFKRDSKL